MDHQLLTTEQSGSLLAIARHQRAQKRESAFLVSAGGEAIYHDDGFNVPLSDNALAMWEKYDYVVFGEKRVGTLPGGFADHRKSLTLTQKALDYERWMSRPAAVRFVLEQIDKSFDRRSLFTGIVVGVLSTLLSQYLLHLLGWF